MAKVSDLYSNNGINKSSPPRPTIRYDTFIRDRKLDIFIACRDLIQIDTFSKSDPLCVLFIERLGQWSEYGRTESISNNVNPRFCQSIEVEIGNDDDMNLKFTIYDLTNFTSQDLRKHDVIGSIEVDLRTLLTTKSPYIDTLKFPGDETPRGAIYVYVKDTEECRSKLRLLIKGSKLSKRGVFGKCNAYFELCRLVSENGMFHPVYRSEVVTRSQDPRWPLAEISLQKLCDNNTETDILFQCWHSIQDGADELIGEARCTTKNLLQKNHKSLQLNCQQKTKRQKPCGCLKILQCYIERQYNVLDFVRGGCKMQFICAIDFTLSNGNPKEMYSSHSVVTQHNEYLESFRSFGSVLSYYCTEKSFPVFGFGAKLCERNTVSHHFALNGNEQFPEIKGLEIVIEIYLSRLQSLTFSGPTYLTPVLHRILCHHVPFSTQSCQSYTTLLILVDGIVNDLHDFINEVEKQKGLSLSIVIVGVGPADFRPMKEICNRSNLEHHSNIHFVTARSQHSKNISGMKVRDISAQVCRDFISYMKVHNIHPNAAQTTTIKPLYESLELDSTAERQTLAKSLSQATSLTNSSCPSCGSHITPVFPVA